MIEEAKDSIQATLRTPRMNRFQKALFTKLSSQMIINQKKTTEKTVDIHGRSLCLFGNNFFRRGISKVATHRFFDPIVLFFIIASTIAMTIESPLDDPAGEKIRILFYVDIVFTVVFLCELVVKVITYGFMCNGQKSYIRNSWNILDFFIVVFSVVSIAFQEQVDLGFIKALRMLRVLRPLRMISRNEGLKVAVTSLINSAPGILNVFVVSGLFFLLFGILGTNFYKGILDYCVIDMTQKELERLIITNHDCMNQGGAWVHNDN
jgi:hypothetical protein